MKRFLFVIGALLVAATACDRGPCADCLEEMAPHHVSMEADEGRSILYVFSRTGALVDSYSSTDGLFDFYLTDEIYDFVVVSGKEGLPRSGVTKKGLLSLPSLLADNADGCFVMVGALPDHLIEADEKITVEVRRLAAKVSCTIHTAFTGALAQLPFQVEDLYLTNVNGSCTLADTAPCPPSESLWFNKMDLEDPPQAGCPSVLLHKPLGRRMAASDSLDCGASLYAYPNASPDSYDRSRWGSRSTRVVVKAVLGGRTTYYPVTLDPVKPNYHYRVDLTISNYGVEHPEDPVSAYSGVDASIAVEAWNDGGSLRGLY